MLETGRTRFLFSDAWALYDAIEELDRGKPRNAAEKAWAPLSGPPAP